MRKYIHGGTEVRELKGVYVCAGGERMEREDPGMEWEGRRGEGWARARVKVNRRTRLAELDRDRASRERHNDSSLQEL